jgi:hypothetical protein
VHDALRHSSATTATTEGTTMGIFDKASALAKKATKAAKEHSDQVEKAVDKVTDTVDKKTGKKHSKQLDQVDDGVHKFLEK